MASFLASIPGYLEAVARETVGRDAAYLRLPRLVAGYVVRPLTLRDYLRLSAECSPFVAGGHPGRDHVAFLLWHQRANTKPDENEQAFAAELDAVDLDFLAASCMAYVSEAMADAPGSSGKSKSYYGLGASIIRTFRHEYPNSSREEILDTPLDELFQELKAIQQHNNPRALLFNRSDRIVSEALRRRDEERARKASESTAAVSEPPRERSVKPRRQRRRKR